MANRRIPVYVFWKRESSGWVRPPLSPGSPSARLRLASGFGVLGFPWPIDFPVHIWGSLIKTKPTTSKTLRKKNKFFKQTRPRLARKHNIASEVGPTLQDAFFFPTRSIREASARQHQARCSAQTGRCKLVCASCSTQVALCKLLGASCSAQVAPCKLVPASGSLQVALCKLLRASCSRQGALRKLVGASWSAQVALCKLLCVSCSAQVALGKALCANWSVQVCLCKLLCTSCSMLVASCDARGPGRNRTRDPPVPGAGARATRQLSRTSSNNKSRKTPRVFAPRPRRFPQRVARAPQKSQETSSCCTSTTPIPAEGRAQKTSSFCTSTTPIPAEGRASMLKIAKNLESTTPIPAEGRFSCSVVGTTPPP